MNHEVKINAPLLNDLTASTQGFQTHQVRNMPPELPEQNLFSDDAALQNVVTQEEIGWAKGILSDAGEKTGSSFVRECARLANENLPVLKTHNRIGERIDFIEYHPAYHELMKQAFGSGVHSLAWTAEEKRPQVARMLLSYLWNQGENGVGCPSVMTYSLPPLLQADPEFGDHILPKVLSTAYDPLPGPVAKKEGITVAMSMTEKQGGSDLRANDTHAVPTGEDREFALTGHKFFCSAPMGDVVLLTAKTDKGVTLFLAPRSLPDGTRNSIRIQRLKDKLGNRSNASSEIELDKTIAYRIGEEGHGIREAIKYMCHYMRMDLSISSAAIMRHALTLALHHTGNRTAFGQSIRDLPQMRNALADLALETEAALQLSVRTARATDDAAHSEKDALLNRVMVPVAKFWNCRRASSVTLEALECHGGMGFVEEQTIARLYREAPINSIWEGTSAMMGLDVLRAFSQDPEIADALLDEMKLAKGANNPFDTFINQFENLLSLVRKDGEAHARRLMCMIAQGLQASLLIRNAPKEVSDSFCASRLGGHWAHEFGTLSSSDTELKKIVDRAALFS